VLAAFLGLELFKLFLTGVLHVHANLSAFDRAGPAPLTDLAANVTLVHGLGVLDRLTWNYPSWSISAEFWTYLVFAAAAVLGGRHRLAVLAGLAVASGAVLISQATDGMNAAEDLGFWRCVLGFATGVAVYDLRGYLPRNGIGRLEVVAVGLIALFLGVAGRGALSFAAPLVFAVAVHVFSFEEGPISRLLKGRAVQALGTWSYSLYMVHAFLLTLLNLGVSVLQRPLFGHEVFAILPGHGRMIVGVSPYLLDAMLAAYIGCVVALARWTYHAIEDPGRRWFNDMLAGRPRKQRPAMPGLASLPLAG
jgi:peptidoglycan/LPS O-acetylase OafA/YrhL